MDYKLLLDNAVFAGEILMKNGAETYRVEDTMYRILKKSNLKKVEVLVMMTGFVATLDDPSIDSMTVLKRITTRGTDLEMIDRVNRISRAFCADELTLEETFRQIKAMWKEKPHVKCNFGAMAAITGGFAVMFGGGRDSGAGRVYFSICKACLQKEAASYVSGKYHLFLSTGACDWAGGADSSRGV